LAAKTKFKWIVTDGLTGGLLELCVRTQGREASSGPTAQKIAPCNNQSIIDLLRGIPRR